MLLRVRAIDRCLDHHGGMLVCSIDPAAPVDVVLERLGGFVMSSPPNGARPVVTPTPEVPQEDGGGSFLELYELFYRGRRLLSVANTAQRRAQPFGMVFAVDDGEELLIRRRRPAAHRSVTGDATTRNTSALDDSGVMSSVDAADDAAANGTLLWSPIHPQAQSPSRAYGTGGATHLFGSPTDAMHAQGSHQPLNRSEGHPRADLARATTTQMGHLSACTAPRAHRRLHDAFQQFLERTDGLAEWYAPFAAKDGLFSLGELCGQSAKCLAQSLDRATPPAAFMEAVQRPLRPPRTRFANVPTSEDTTPAYEVPFALEVYAHRLITAAHRAMKARGLVIDWPKRLRQYIKNVDPERAMGADIVQSIQIRERLLDAPLDVVDAASAVAMENAWNDLRRQYEEHLINTIRDAESKGYRLRPIDDGEGVALPSMATTAAGADPSTTGGLNTSRRQTEDAHGASDAFVVMCPDCQHTFSYVPPPASQRLQHMYNDMARKEAASIAIQKEHAIRVQQLTDAIDGLAAKLRQSEAARTNAEDVIEIQKQRLSMLEGENHAMRRERVDAQQQRSAFGNPAFHPSALPSFVNADRRGADWTAAADQPSASVVGVRTATKRPDASLAEGIRERVVHSDRDAALPGMAVDRHPDAAVGPEDRRRIRRVLVDYLERHNPDGVLMVDVILSAWRDREYELERVLRLPPSRAPASLLAHSGPIE